MEFEKELSKKMFVITNEMKSWNLKMFSKWVKQNQKVSEDWIREMNLFFQENNLSVRLIFVKRLEFCVVYEK